MKVIELCYQLYRIMKSTSSTYKLRDRGEYWKETIQREQHLERSSLRGHFGTLANMLPVNALYYALYHHVNEDWIIGKQLLTRVNDLLEGNKVKERLSREADMRWEIEEEAEKSLREESEYTLRRVENLEQNIAEMEEGFQRVEDKIDKIQTMLQRLTDTHFLKLEYMLKE